MKSVVVALVLALCGGLPAHAAAPDCSLERGALPSPHLPEGRGDPSIPVEHVIVQMQENRSFDHYFGKLNDPKFYGAEVDGFPAHAQNPDKEGNPVYPYHETNYCSSDVGHGWDASHRIWNGGLNDRFVIENYKGKKPGRRAMSYYTDEDIPFYYGLANTFAIGDRYFCSVMGPTVPNRFYMLTGTSFGRVDNKLPKLFKEYDQPTIFEQLTRYGVSWRYYYVDLPYPWFFQKFFWKNLRNMKPIGRYYKDLRKGELPQVVFLESAGLWQSEHPPLPVQFGQNAVAKRVNALMNSQYWRKSVMFLTYDEGGGFYDHVPPPEACVPDGVEPILKDGMYQARFDRYGSRVPLIAISPYAKRHHVSHVTYDHTSILRFIATKFNTPALSRRDANADPMFDLFDFDNPDFGIPKLPEARIDWGKFAKCASPSTVRSLQRLVSREEI